MPLYTFVNMANGACPGGNERFTTVLLSRFRAQGKSYTVNPAWWMGRIQHETFQYPDSKRPDVSFNELQVLLLPLKVVTLLVAI